MPKARPGGSKTAPLHHFSEVQHVIEILHGGSLALICLLFHWQDNLSHFRQLIKN
jgi:hypothetical protein